MEREEKIGEAAEVETGAVAAAGHRGLPSWLVSGVAHGGLFVLLTLIWVGVAQKPPKNDVQLRLVKPEETVTVGDPPRAPPEPEINRRVDVYSEVPIDVPTPEVSEESPTISEFSISEDDSPQDQALAGDQGLSFGEAGSPGDLAFGLGGSPGTGGFDGRTLGTGPGPYTNRNKDNQARLIYINGRNPHGKDGEPGIIPRTDGALRWLAEHQEPEGYWDASKYGQTELHNVIKNEPCSYDVGVTGLALLAFVGAGHTASGGTEFSDNVRRCLYWLEENQQTTGPEAGRWGGGTGYWTGGAHYGQAIATIGVAEHYGMDGSHGPMAQRAIDYLVYAMSEDGGWNYYTDRFGGRARSDISITGWAVMAAKAGRTAGLVVPDELFEAPRRLIGIMDEDYEAEGRIFYAMVNGDVKPKLYHGPEALHGIAALSLVFLGAHPGGQWFRNSAQHFVEKGVNLDNFYEVYYKTFFMFQMGDEYWAPWRDAFVDPLLARQRMDENDRETYGSWDPEPDEFGSKGGRVYTTAMGVLTLEVFYRYQKIND